MSQQTKSQVENRVVRAREFQVTDASGQVRGVFGIGDRGTPRLRMEHGSGWIELEVFKDDSACVTLGRGSNEAHRVELGVDAEGESAIIIGDKYGTKPFIRIGLDERGAPVEGLAQG